MFSLQAGYSLLQPDRAHQPERKNKQKQDTNKNYHSLSVTGQKHEHPETGRNRGGHAICIVGYDDNKQTADPLTALLDRIAERGKFLPPDQGKKL